MNCAKCNTCGIEPECEGYSVRPKGADDYLPEVRKARDWSRLCGCAGAVGRIELSTIFEN